MCELTERAYKYGVKDAKVESTKNLIIEGDYSFEKIARILKLPLEEVEKIARSLKEGN